MKKTDLRKALTFIEPGPVTLITTFDGKRNNAMTVSWTMAIDFDGHIAITTGAWNYSFGTLLKSGECAVCIPPADMAETVVGIGMVSGADTDKFRKFSITALPAEYISAPLIAECIACIECKVEDYIEEYGFVILKAVNVWINENASDNRLLHAVGDGTFTADGERVNLRERMKEKLPPGL